MPNVDVRKVIQELVVPELKELKSELHEFRAETRSELKRLDEKIDSGLARLDEKIDSKHNEATGLFQRLDEKIDSLRNEMNIRFNAMDEKIEINLEFRDRFAVLETKVAALIASK